MPYLTPKTTPVDTVCWRLSIPNSERFLAAVLGQLTELFQSWNWEQTDGIPVDDTMQLAIVMYDNFEQGTCGMIGSLLHYVTTTPPDHVLPCDGTQYLRVDYPKLYAKLPVNLIVDADNFITPTIQDSFILASGATYSHFDTGGETEHTLTTAEMPSHQHTYDKETYNVDVESVGVPDPTGVGLPAIPTLTSSAGGDNAHNNMPPYIAFKVGIVAK